MMSKEEPTGSIGVGDRVRIIGGGPMARGLIGVVQRLDTSRQGRCYVTSGGKISLGVFDSEESAREACESHYLANKKTGGHEPATMKSQ